LSAVDPARIPKVEEHHQDFKRHKVAVSMIHMNATAEVPFKTGVFSQRNETLALRGNRYEVESRGHGGARKGEISSGNCCHLKTDEVLAKE
jgi:hypothetical protein